MDIDMRDLQAKIFSWIQKQHDEQCGEESHRQLEGMEHFTFASALLGRKLLDDLEQIMEWGEQSIHVVPKIAAILTGITTVLFLLYQIGVRLIPGFHIP